MTQDNKERLSIETEIPKIRTKIAQSMGFIDRLKKLSKLDIVLMYAGLGVLILAPVTEHFMMRPSADRLLTPGFGSRKGIGAASKFYEPGMGGFAPDMAGIEGDVLAPLSARDPSSLITAPEGAVKPPAMGIRDAVRGAAKVAVSKAVRSAGAPAPIPKFRAFMRGLGMARDGSGTSGKGILRQADRAPSKAVRAGAPVPIPKLRSSMRGPGMARGLAGKRILRQAARAPSKAARRSSAGPVAMAGYRGVSHRTESADGDAFEQLKAKMGSAASHMSAPGAASALVRTAGESVEVGAGTGGHAAPAGPGEGEKFSTSSDSSLHQQGQAGETLAQLAGMRAERERTTRQVEKDFWKLEEVPQRTRSTIDNILTAGLIKPIGEKVADLWGKTSYQYACFGIVPGTENLPPEKQCMPINARQPLAINDSKDEMINRDANGQCPCGWGRYTGSSSGSSTTPSPAPGHETPAQTPPTQAAIENVIVGDSMAGAVMNFVDNVTEAKAALEGGDALAIRKAHELFGDAVAAAEEIIKQVDIGINVVENSMKPLPPAIVELKTLSSGREQQVNAMSGALDSMEPRKNLAELYSTVFINACNAGRNAYNGKNLTSPNCNLANTYARLMMAENPDEFNAVMNDTRGTALAHYPALIIWNCNNAARKIGGARGVLEEENKRIASAESLAGSLPMGLTDTKRSRDYLVLQISDAKIFLQNEPMTPVIMGQVYRILTGAEIEISLPITVADADLRDAPIDPYMGFCLGVIELLGKTEQVEPEKNFSDAYINNPESGVEEPQDYFSMMRMSVRIDSIMENMGAIKDNLGESMNGFLASAKDFIKKARDVDTSLMGTIPGEPSVTGAVTPPGGASVTGGVTLPGEAPPIIHGVFPVEPEPAGPTATDHDSGSAIRPVSVGLVGCSGASDINDRKARIEEIYDVQVIDDTVRWKRKDLGNLEGTLENLPEIFHGKESLDTIARSKLFVDYKGEKNEYVMGVYKNGEESITLFDRANEPDSFTTSKHEFTGTLVHELAHSVQDYDPVSNSKYSDPYENPLVIDYAKSMGWKNIGYKYDEVLKEWDTTDEYFGVEAELPSSYAEQDALEDMAESVMYYYGNPRYLKMVSPKRYAFIKERIFNGKEYNNNWKIRGWGG